MAKAKKISAEEQAALDDDPAARAERRRAAARAAAGEPVVAARLLRPPRLGRLHRSSPPSALLAFVRSAFPRVLFTPPSTFKAGLPNEYTIGEVSERFKQEQRVWIIREADGFYALFAKCTHLGCTPRWLKVEEKFKCPCHGSGFRKSGDQLRRAGAAAAGALPHRARRGRAAGRRQERRLPLRARRLGRGRARSCAPDDAALRR